METGLLPVANGELVPLTNIGIEIFCVTTNHSHSAFAGAKPPT
jgi:hypothetical protein